jgi:hypothetical protein
MAMTFTTLKNTNQETVIHFTSAAAETGTIAINTLAASTQELVVGGTPTVDIVKFICTGELDSKVVVTRNNKTVIACAPENEAIVEFNAFGIPVINDNTSNIVINNAVAKEVTGWIVLRKQAGWATKVEDSTFGSYDDPTRVGASTTISGSPDKV